MAILKQAETNWKDWVDEEGRFKGCTLWVGPRRKSALAGKMLCPGVYELKAIGCSEKGTGDGKKLLKRWAEETLSDKDVRERKPWIIILEAMANVVTYYQDNFHFGAPTQRSTSRL